VLETSSLVSAPLDRCLADPGYTPPQSALRELIAGLENVDEAGEKALRRALLRAGSPSLAPALAALERASSKLRERLLQLIGDLASMAPADLVLAPLGSALTDPAPRCQRAAARALGKLGDARAEAPLLDALDRVELAERRAIVDALGKLGSAQAAARLAALRTDDLDLQRRIENARALIERRSARGSATALVFDRALPLALTVVARCRAGLSTVLADEAAAPFSVVRTTDTGLELEYRGTLGDLLQLRTALDFAAVIPIPPGSAEPAERIALALESELALAVLSSWANPTPSLRLSFVRGGPRRALAWAVARRLSARGLVRNDPRGAPFTAEIAPDALDRLLLVPRLSPDPRFGYRKLDVPASSHPTVAAALARLAGVRPDDVVWDPFVGSGLELIERARLGSYARLVGTDLEPTALTAARTNFEAAAIERAQLVRANACEFAPQGITLILTNPPMGRRVARDGSLRSLLERFVLHASRVLSPGGRMLWISPLDQITARAATRAGLVPSAGPELDLGGFTARIQAFERRAGRRATGGLA
jgi:hypothetical protein